MRSLSRPTIAVLAVAGMILLGGCSVIEQPGTSDDAPSSARPAPARTDPVPESRAPSASPGRDGDTIDCGGADTEISGDDLERTVVGDCPVVQLSGRDLEVDLTGATVGELRIDGDDNDVDAASLGTLTIHGQDNEVDAADIGSLDVTGDGNDVTAGGAIGSVAVAGDDNEVDADRIDAVATSGSGNQIRTR